MAIPTQDEIQEFLREEIEYQNPQDDFEEAYIEAVIQGNENDDDDYVHEDDDDE